MIGLGLGGFALYQLAQPKPTPAPGPLTCPTGQHLENGVCVPDGPPPPPPPPSSPYHVAGTGGLGLIVRAGPSTSYARVGSLGEGQGITIACQTVGQTIMRSGIWDRLSSPIAGYVSDWYVDTPVTGGFSPGLAVCAGSPPPPPPGLGLPPTGKAALSSLGQIVARMIIATGCSWGDADYIVLARSPYATASPRFGRVWIKDKYTWDSLAVPRSAINIVTPALLLQIADAGSLRRTVVRNYGDAWVWEGGINFLGQTVWDTAMQAVNRGPFSVLKTPAGWCS